MTIQASAQVTWDAADAQEAMDTVNGWVVHEGARITLLLEQPERAVTQLVMGQVSVTPAVADGDGSVTLVPDDPDAWPAQPPVEEPPAEEPVDPGWTGGVAPPGEEGGVVDPGWTGGTVPPELEGGPPVPDEEPVVPDEEPVPDQPAELSASFTYDRPVMGVDTQFDATASTGSIETYDWTFAGVKQSDAGPTPTWQFAKNGTYTVKLVVTDADGVTATDSQSVKVLTA